jgi:hypothetical protein
MRLLLPTIILLGLLLLTSAQTVTFKIPRCPSSSSDLRSFSNQTDIGLIHWFVHDQNGSIAGVSPTTVHACHDNSLLYLNFSNTDSDIIANLKGCNSALYT